MVPSTQYDVAVLMVLSFKAIRKNGDGDGVSPVAIFGACAPVERPVAVRRSLQ
jgi:hypothetical protein